MFLVPVKAGSNALCSVPDLAVFLFHSAWFWYTSKLHSTIAAGEKTTMNGRFYTMNGKCTAFTFREVSKVLAWIGHRQ